MLATVFLGLFVLLAVGLALLAARLLSQAGEGVKPYMRNVPREIDDARARDVMQAHVGAEVQRKHTRGLLAALCAAVAALCAAFVYGSLIGISFFALITFVMAVPFIRCYLRMRALGRPLF